MSAEGPMLEYEEWGPGAEAEPCVVLKEVGGCSTREHSTSTQGSLCTIRSFQGRS
jgi:hypothetical protein